VEGAQVVLIDTDRHVRACLRRFLEDSGHLVITEISDPYDAPAILEQLEEVDVDAIVIEYNQDDSLRGRQASTEIVQVCRSLFGDTVKIAAFSTIGTMENVDAQIQKPNFGLLLKWLADLPDNHKFA
jgi:DNA-binding NarL/FixJ family response regulator